LIHPWGGGVKKAKKNLKIALGDKENQAMVAKVSHMIMEYYAMIYTLKRAQLKLQQDGGSEFDQLMAEVTIQEGMEKRKEWGSPILEQVRWNEIL